MRVWIFSLALFLVSLNIEKVTAKSCTSNGVTFKNKDHWLRNDCKKKLKCDNGNIKQYNYNCPSNSQCKNGQCQCNAGWKVKQRTSKGLLKNCEKQSSNKCKVGNKEYNNNAQWLRNDCKKKFKCDKGSVKTYNYNCPSNSQCKNGKCQCNAGWKVKQRTSKGLLKNCEKQSSNKCKVGNKEYNNNAQWLRNDCKKKFKCDKGSVKTYNYNCPSNSQCKNGKCQCNAGWKVKQRTSKGLLKNCEKQSSNKCKVGNKEYNNNAQWLRNDCKKKFKCDKGSVKTYNYNCPSNSQCKNGQCQCNAGWKVKQRTSKGLLKNCEKQSSNKCKVGNKEYNNNAQWLRNDCKKKFKCDKGSVKTYNYNCPSNSQCKNGQCQCNAGWKVKQRTSKGLLKNCEKQSSNKCKVGNKEYNNNAQWLRNDCKKKFKCDKGSVKTYNYNCPSNSQCKNGQCQCNAGWKVKQRTSKGLLKNCEKQSSNKCKVGNKEYNNNAQWLRNDCKKKFKCDKGSVKTYNYNCPSNSQCKNGKCQCEAGWKVKQRTSKGLLKNCEKQQNKCRQNNKDYQNGAQWLKQDCKKKFRCVNGAIKTDGYNCPSNSECQNGQCVCKNGFKVKEKTSKGLLKNCQKIGCKHAGKNYNNGAHWLQQDCKKKFRCQNGQTKQDNYNCPANSQCNNGQCKCKSGWKLKQRTSKGLLKNCERNDNKCRQNGKTYNNKAVWLKNGCNMKYKCQNGQIKEETHQCPDNSFCKNGKCTCKGSYEVKQRTSKGLLKSCILKSNGNSCNQNNKLYENGKAWLQNDCKKKFICDKGQIKTKNHNCPSQSSCSNGQCRCKNNFEVKSRDSRGLLKKCQEKRDCNVNGKTFKNGASWLNGKCDRKISCKNRETSGKAFRCPSHSSCKYGGQCVCNFGYETKSLDKNGILKRCKEIAAMKCKSGFKRFAGLCLSINKNSKVNFWQAHDKCKKKGGRLVISDDSFGLYQKLSKDRKYKDRRYFILGDTAVSAKTMNDFKSQAAKKFVMAMMQRYKVGGNIRFKAFKRFSGRPEVADWNYNSPVSSRCMALDENGPNLYKCHNKMGYICEQGSGDDPNDIFWSKWYNLNEPNNKGEKETLEDILAKFNKDYKDKNDRLCTQPISMQCRQVGTNKLFSKQNTQGLKLHKACERGRFICFNNKQPAGKTCPNAEVRFKCLRDDPNDCRVNMVKKGCQSQGKVCVNRRTGAVCIKQKKPKNKSNKIHTDTCYLNSKKITTYRCKATGDPHYSTMDGFKYDFMGICSYDFMSTCNGFQASDTYPAFKIVTKNYKHRPNVRPSWTKGFSLTIGDNNYIFLQGKMLVNDREVNAIGYDDDVIKIDAKACGKKVVLIIRTNFCLKIQWDNMYGLYVFVPDHYKNAMCGLCGNFDGKANNDLRKEGSTTKMSSDQINKEYVVAGFMKEEDVCPMKIDEPKVCTQAEKDKISKPNMCGIFDVDKGSPLVQAVLDSSDDTSREANLANLREEFKECVDDVCWDPTTDRCYDIERTINAIHQALDILDPELDKAWRIFADCENEAAKRCEEQPNMEFVPNLKPACQDTCNDKELSKNCDDEFEEPGCACKAGFYLDAKMNCVPLDECDNSCDIELDDGKRFTLNNGDEYVAVPCALVLICKDGNLEEKKLTPCSTHADCIEGGRKCRCHDGFVPDGNECKSDLSCRKGYVAYGEKCYKFVQQKKDWHSAAIICGKDGSVLARYDEPEDSELANFIGEFPKMYVKARAQSRRMYCKPSGQCKLPRGFFGISIRLKDRKKDLAKCKGKFGFAADKLSVVVTGDCKATFIVAIFKASRVKPATHFRVWIGGNNYIVDQYQRGAKSPFNIDPPFKLDLTAFNKPHGCFQANVNKDGELVVSPNPKCQKKQPFICEYDNFGELPHNPNDFKRLKEKGNFQEAIEMCEKLNRPLAGIYNSKQNDKIRNMLRQIGGDGWIGGTYANNKFEWSDGNPFKFIFWRDREPKQLQMNMQPASYTKYYRAKGFSSLSELRQKLAREGKPDYVCPDPISLECSAREVNNGPWRNNFNQKNRAMVCKKDNIRCRKGKGLNCNTFRVRVLCPSDENQCATLKKENINPCTGGRSCIPVRNHFICKCTGEASWDHQKQTCHKSCGHCTASGDPHYTSFFGDKYDFMGTCMYKFAGVCELDEFKTSPNFDVFTKNEKCGSRGASCIFAVEVHLRNIPYTQGGNDRVGNFIFKIARNNPKNYFLNDRKHGLGEMSIPKAFKVVRKNNYFNLFSPALSLEVFFSGSKLSLNLPDRFVDKMCGLCGDCSSNKFRMKDGTLVEVPKKGNKLDRQAVIPVANDWIVPYDGSDPELCKVVEPIGDCTAEMEAKVKGPDMCGIFKDATSAISDCFDKIDPEQFYNDCVVDACHEDPMVSVCGSVRSYAQECMKNKGIIMDWRSGQFCPMDCKEKMYRSDASCEPMCGSDDLSTAVCDEEPEEGCVCPSGFMRQGDECVLPENCGCKILIGESESITIKPGASFLLPRCEEIAKCVEGENGASEEIRESVDLGPNAICVEDPLPRVDCARGYILQEDGKSCKRDPEACSEGYKEKSGMCIREPKRKKVWRQAVYVCNENDGTLALINTQAKWEEIIKIMEANAYEQVFISGQVVVKAGADDRITLRPVLKKEQKGKIEYYNFDFHSPPVVDIMLSDEIDINMIREETVLALVARLGADGTAYIVAVPRDTVANFVCEERYVKPPEEEWYGPCNSDTLMDDNGDQETKQSLKKLKDCKVCPHPMEVGCVKNPKSTGTVAGECKITKSGTYYSCSQGKDCIDYAVETKCARDVDECKKGLHDCPESSTCKNTIGAYVCKCDSDFPLMIRGKCHKNEVCAMNGPKRIDDWLYNIVGFSKVPGFVRYSCPYKIFETCAEKYERGSNMPIISIYIYIQKTKTQQINPIFGGWIINPEDGQIKYWAAYDALLRSGKFLYGDSASSLDVHDLGFGCLSVRTNFIFAPPNILVVQHFDRVFRFGVTFPVHFGIEVSSQYAAMGCGMCTYSPPGPNEAIILTDEQEQYLSGKYMNDPSQCSIDHVPEPTTPPPPPTTEPAPVPTTQPPPPSPTTQPPPPPTTQPPPPPPTTQPPPPPPTTQPPPPPTTQPPPPPPTTQPPPPPPTTQPPPPPTTQPPPPPTTQPPPPPPTTQPPPTTPIPTPVIDNFCEDDVMAFCLALSEICTFEYWKCREDLCYANIDYCTYLETAILGECEVGTALDAFVHRIRDMCVGYCNGADMSFEYQGTLVPDMCSNPVVDDGENNPGMGGFACGCEDGYKLSGGQCVPEEECGCLVMDGLYIPKDTVFVTLNCSMKFICLGNHNLEEIPMACSAHATCEMTENGPTCVCEEGYFGDAEMPNGCKNPDDEDETKVCYTKTNSEGFQETTCKCKDGYISNCTDCVDVDECTENKHDCDLSVEKCENIPGSFKCSCALGFEAFEGECKDVDECQRGLARCGSNAGCVNNPGSYECRCCAGFKYNSLSDECERDPNSGVDIFIAQPKCCLECDDPERCDPFSDQPAPFCYVGAGQLKEYPSYKAMFEYYCVNNLPLPEERIREGECTDVDPTSIPVEPTNPSGGSQTTVPGGAGPTAPGSGEGPGGATAAPGGETTSGSSASTPPPPKSCDDPKFCEKIPPPPPALSEGQVCGPSNQVNKKTFPSYCDMVKSICKANGGPSNIPNVPIAADAGECPKPTTTTPPPPPTTKSPPPQATKEPVTQGPNPATDAGTPAPQEQTTRAAPVTSLPPSDPLLTPWMPWSRCRVNNVEMSCGLGKQSRTRSVKPYEDGREVLPVDEAELYDERICFKPCDPEDPDFTPDLCPADAGVCGEDDSMVCGSIGKGGADTFINECELNVEACKAGKKPNVISKGECGEDQKPKQMCESGGRDEWFNSDKQPEGYTCTFEKVMVKRCSHLGCEGGYDNCCIATEYEMVYGSMDCVDDDGNQAVGTRAVLSAKSCRCSKGEDDDAGADNITP